MSNTKDLGRAPGKATSFDIAFLAGVSQPTVSRALRGSPSVSEETRQRVREIASQLNYKVDKNASNLRFQRSNTLALLFFEDPTSDDSAINPFFVSMLGWITRACGSRGYDLLISFQQQSGNWHEEYEDSHKADGLILLGYGDYLQHRVRLQGLIERGTHFVSWGAVQPGQTGVSIGSDNYEVATRRRAIWPLSGVARLSSWAVPRATVRNSSIVTAAMFGHWRRSARMPPLPCKWTPSAPNNRATPQLPSYPLAGWSLTPSSPPAT